MKQFKGVYLNPFQIKRISIIILLSVSSVILVSCGGTTLHLASGSLNPGYAFKINSYYGCCGCKASYVTIYKGMQKKEQIVYSYNCPTNKLPTKFVFNYKKGGGLLNCERYIATTQNDFVDSLNRNEMEVFRLLDSDSGNLKYGFKPMNFKVVKGFRKPNKNEAVHPFPLMKKGYKVTLQ